MKNFWHCHKWLFWAVQHTVLAVAFFHLDVSWLSGFCAGLVLLSVYMWADVNLHEATDELNANGRHYFNGEFYDLRK